jgi:ribose/xylose/arabinose/galactoside ABC-type transport system permease subunit
MDATARSGHWAQALLRRREASVALMIIAIVALGQGLVIIARAIDLSVGSVRALPAVITAVVAPAEPPETLAISDRCVVLAGAGQRGAHLHG